MSALAQRYEVRSITGYPITPDAHQPSADQSTTWWVADTAYCQREVQLSKRTTDRRPLKDGTPNVRYGARLIGSTLTKARTVAEFTAAMLNAEEEAWERAS